MKLRLLIIGALGLALALYLIFHIGVAAVFKAALAVGPRGMIIVIAYQLALYVLLGGAWQIVARGYGPTWLRVFAWGRVVRESAAELLPFSHIGGFVIGSRAAVLDGVNPPVAYASMVADVTMEAAAQIVYVALGTFFLFERTAPMGKTSALVPLMVGVLVLALAVTAGFVIVQRKSVSVTRKLTQRFLGNVGAIAEAVAAELAAIYRTPLRAVLCMMLHIGTWLAAAFGTWIAFRQIGKQVDFQAVVAIDSLVYAAKGAAVIMPNALGVQEAVYSALTPLFGVGPEFGLAMSLIKRARDIAIGVPVLLIWQIMEGHSAVKKKTGTSS